MGTKTRIWLVSHVEVILYPGDHRVDEAVTFLASSRRAALRRIRETWWRVDDLEGWRSG